MNRRSFWSATLSLLSVPYCAAGQATATAVQTITAPEFEDMVIESKQPVLVFFWADWCGPCRMIVPSLEDIATEMVSKLKIVRLDVEKEPEIGIKHGVRSIPALLLFKNGKCVATHIGTEPKHRLLSWLMAMGIDS